MTREILFKVHVTREFFSCSCVKLNQDPHCYPVRFTSLEVKLSVPSGNEYSWTTILS